MLRKMMTVGVHEELWEAKAEVEAAQDMLDYADPDMIDYAVLRITAAEKKFRAVVARMKEQKDGPVGYLRPGSHQLGA